MCSFRAFGGHRKPVILGHAAPAPRRSGGPSTFAAAMRMGLQTVCPSAAGTARMDRYGHVAELRPEAAAGCFRAQSSVGTRSSTVVGWTGLRTGRRTPAPLVWRCPRSGGPFLPAGRRASFARSEPGNGRRGKRQEYRGRWWTPCTRRRRQDLSRHQPLLSPRSRNHRTLGSRRQASL